MRDRQVLAPEPVAPQVFGGHHRHNAFRSSRRGNEENNPHDQENRRDDGNPKPPSAEDVEKRRRAPGEADAADHAPRPERRPLERQEILLHDAVDRRPEHRAEQEEEELEGESELIEGDETNVGTEIEGENNEESNN